MRWQARVAAPLCLLWCDVAAGVHYTCAPDEASGEIQGEVGVVCGPRCNQMSGAFDCPTDLPEGTIAQPQCMLADVDQTAYCGLLCQMDAHCPSGNSCRQVGTPSIGVCIHPVSFWEWAKGSGPKRRKFTVGNWVNPASGQAAPGFRIAKASAALSSLKKKYGIADGEADVLTVHELLSSTLAIRAAQGPSGPQAASYTPPSLPQQPQAAPYTPPGFPQQPQAQPLPGTPQTAGWLGGGLAAMPSSGISNAALPQLQTGMQQQTVPQQMQQLQALEQQNRALQQQVQAQQQAQQQGQQQQQQQQGRSFFSPLTHDIGYFANNLRSGLPGIEREIHDTIWNVEHLGNRYVATELLRSVLLLAFAYLACGCAYKYQAMGARGMDMIPNIGFWMEYPKLVADGVQYAMITGGELLGTGGAGRYQASPPPGFSSRADRDSFANFEPSK